MCEGILKSFPALRILPEYLLDKIKLVADAVYFFRIFYRGVRIVAAVAIIRPVKDHRPVCKHKGLEKEARILKRSARCFIMADVILSEEIPPVNAAPGVHHIQKGFRILRRIKYLPVVFLIGGKMIIGQLHISGCRIRLKAVKIRLYKVKIILTGDFIKILIHFQRHIVIRLHNSDILSARRVQSAVHGFSVAAVRPVQKNDARILRRVFLQHRKGPVCRAVIDADNLNVRQCLAPHRLHTLFQIIFLIVNRYQNGYFCHCNSSRL